jgi:hypothetical protein
LVAQRAALDGRVNVAQHVLESATEVASDPIDAGRLLADRARNSRKQGRLDLAEAQANELRRRAQRLPSAELTALAIDQLAALAQTRGNFVDLRSHLEAAVSAAREAGTARLMASAHLGLGVESAMRGRYGESVEYLWRSHQEAGGDPVISSAALGNLAQTLLVSGRPAESRKVAMLVLQSKPTIQNTLPVLGGYAVASARMADANGVAWASGQVQHISKARHYAREVAGALIDCASALDAINRAAQAEVLRERAEAMAREFGFHDLTFVEALIAGGSAPVRQAFTGYAAQVADEIASLEVSSLEADVLALS